MQRVLLETGPDDCAITANGRRPHAAVADAPRSVDAFPRPINNRHDKGYVPRRRVSGWHSRAIDRGGLGWTISGRSREGRFITDYENLLVEHLRREPSITERLLIQRCARMALHIELMDEAAFVKGEVFSTSDNARYCAWSNGLARMLVKLGLEPTTVPEPPRASLSDWVQDRQRKTRAE
jgi:hypothetical protein